MTDNEEPTQAEPETRSPEEVDALITDFEAKLASGEFGDQPFHNLVMAHLYPLLGDGSLSQERFASLVQKWATDHYPFDWQVRSFTNDA